MQTQPFVVTPNTYPPGLNVVGEKITVLASQAQTQGYELFLQQGDEGTGPPSHSHDWDESFYVVKGRIEIAFGDQRITATSGTLVHLPAGTIHSFRFGPGGGEMFSVAGHTGQAARLFTTIDREIPAGAPDIPKLIAVAETCGVSFALPAPSAQ